MTTNGRHRDGSSNHGVDDFVRHNEYYLPDGNLHLLVENTHFRVHSFFFSRESAMFRKKLEAPVTPGREREGSSDSNAILIKNVPPDQFAKFLWVFYDPRYSRSATVEDWVTILNLADKWGFAEIKALAINSLERLDMPVIERIALYQKYDLPDDVLCPHYVSACSRPEMPTVEEIDILGSGSAHLIFSIREKLLSTQPGIKPLDKIDPKIFQKGVCSYFLSQKKKGKQVEDQKVR